MAGRVPYEEPALRHFLGAMSVPCTLCGALHWLAEKLSTSSNRSPKFGDCCAQGKIVLPALPDPPAELRELYTSNVDFQENMWKYNRAFAFTSLGVNQDHSINGGRSQPVFKISGELHHLSGALTARGQTPPVYSQLYILEPQSALRQRLSQNESLNPEIMATVQQSLLTSHQYAPIYKHAFEVLRNYNAVQNVEVRLRAAPGLDKRTYNVPTADEVAVLLPDSGVAPLPRDIVLRLRQDNNFLDRISELHPGYAPLQYPLLFPYGTNGWHADLKLFLPHGHEGRQARRRDENEHEAEELGDEENGGEEDGKRLTLCRYTAFRLMVRAGFNILHRGRSLFTRYVVDMFAAIEQQRLRWIMTHQSQFRTARLNNLQDANMRDPDNFTLEQIGKRVFLPSSHTGSPRNMAQCFQDSMAIARYHGKVDLFLTMTTNPDWPEITAELLPGQTAYDRPDLVSRVFRLKAQEMINNIYRDGIFGCSVAYVYTIEFQKRGLPHIHLLIFLHRPHKLLTPQAVDSCISAKWPDPVTEPLLFETVRKRMVHGPCGALNPRAPCMVDGKCSKGYPKPFEETTSMASSGYPRYQRPNDGRMYEVRGVMADNPWIVPHSPYLIAKFDCHINLECCISINSVAYTFKYIQKGPDRGALERLADGEQPNEVKQYLDGRYISPPDAAWRIFRFLTHKNTPKVQRLQIHLPGHQNVVFREDGAVEEVIEAGAAKDTTLTAFFRANLDRGELGEMARSLTYQEFPQALVYDRRNGAWKLRKREPAIGRMYFVKPTAGAIFYLRCLLTVVKGPTSFEDLRRVPGVNEPLPSFHDACLARGLLEDDGEWRMCLLEASRMQVGARLRRLFSTLLLFGEPSRPDQLWVEFRVECCSDLKHRIRGMPAFQHMRGEISDEVAFDYGLFLLDRLLREAGRMLSEWGCMPQPALDWARHTSNPLISEQLNYDPNIEQATFDLGYQTFNPEQRAAFDTIFAAVEQQQPQVFLLSGSAGTGKTFLYNTLCAKIRCMGWIVLCVSSSGISALLIKGGRTAHSMFKIPIDGLEDGSTCHIPRGSDRAELMCQARAIIWDEIGAQHRHAIEAVERTLRDVRQSNRLFGGIPVVLGGDFLQTLPVVPGGSREDVVNACIQSSPLWPHIRVLRLSQNMRLQAAGSDDTRRFAAWLADVGHGRTINGDGQVRSALSAYFQTCAHYICFVLYIGPI